MKQSNVYKIVMGLLILVLIIGTGICIAIRPPSETNGPQVVAAVEATGRIGLLVDQCASGCRSAIQLDSTNSQEEYDRARAWLVALNLSVKELLVEAPDAGGSWIPVEEAASLLERTGDAVTATLKLIPNGPLSEEQKVTADVLETDPNLVGITKESQTAVTEQFKILEADALQLRAKVERAVLMTSLARETISGFEIKYVLLFLLILSVIVACLTIRRAVMVLDIPPEQALESKIKLDARLNSSNAIEECYKHSRRLLQIADELFTRSKLLKHKIDSTESRKPVEDAR